MCCLFGVIDYRNSLSSAQMHTVVTALARAAEARGTDATGIAYSCNGKHYIYKRPYPAHFMHFHIPRGVHTIMGHTRMTTQGDGTKFNENNHPFSGVAGVEAFALAHNGMISNDHRLRKEELLPKTKIETDSYITVQLLEKYGDVSFSGLKQMAEKLRGTFTITVLDSSDNLYFVRGNNPMTIYHYPALGVYLYASTDEILKRAVSNMFVKLGRHEEVDIDMGDILCIDRDGNIVVRNFSISNICGYTWSYDWDSFRYPWELEEHDAYVDELKAVAGSFGYSPEDIDFLIESGISPEEIEEYFYSIDTEARRYAHSAY